MTRTLEEIQAEILAQVKRENFVAGYLGAMWPRENDLTRATARRWYGVGSRWRKRQHRRMRLFGAIGEAFHRDHATPNLVGLQRYAARQYGLLKMADIRLAREYRRF